MRRAATLFASLVSVGSLVVAGCGSSGDSSLFAPPNAAQSGADGGGAAANLTGPGGGHSGGGGPCVNLECQQVQCAGGGTTSVSGTIYDPAGINPLYNIIVYVPNAPVAAFTPGVSCDVCGTVQSGSPLVSTLTDAAGHFTLTNVPVGAEIPLVIQIGRWRRQIKIPTVSQCTDNPLTDKNLTRLPRNKSEGDIPLMAISTGKADPFECLLLKMGIDSQEFTAPTSNGRVHFFKENGADLSPSAPPGSALWSKTSTLKEYDLVFLPCEGNPVNPDDSADHAQPALGNLEQYTNVGGRVFTTHYSYAWTQAIWPQTGKWDLDQTYLNDIDASIDTSFPKGKAFADWLQNVNASPSYAKLPIVEGRHDLDKVVAPPSQQWVTLGGIQTGPSPTQGDTRVTNSAQSVQHMTFNTPVGAAADAQCGKVVYSDFHVSANALNTNASAFPQTCKGGGMTAQEKALEFMIYDLSSCIQNDGNQPQPPPPAIK